MISVSLSYQRRDRMMPLDKQQKLARRRELIDFVKLEVWYVVAFTAICLAGAYVLAFIL